MALFHAHIRLLSIPRYNFALPRVQCSPRFIQPAIGKPVHHRSVFRCCAVTVGNGSFEDSGDGTLAASGNPPRLTNAADSDQTYAMANSPNSELKGGVAPAEGKELWIERTESRIERAIFDFRFLTLMAIGGSLVGSLLCFLKGCGFICESFIAYTGMCLNGLHTGKVILRLVEAVDVYLVGTVMLIFGMGLYGLFISNESKEGKSDRALKNTTLFGMFSLTKRPLWMRITTLDTLKTKLGHVIVMILLVKLFEKSKTVHITSSVDLLSR